MPKPSKEPPKRNSSENDSNYIDRTFRYIYGKYNMRIKPSNPKHQEAANGYSTV